MIALTFVLNDKTSDAAHVRFIRLDLLMRDAYYRRVNRMQKKGKGTSFYVRNRNYLYSYRSIYLSGINRNEMLLIKFWTPQGRLVVDAAAAKFNLYCICILG